MEYGDKIKLFQNLRAQGRATPLDTKVPLTDTALWYIRVFELLTRERSIGMTSGPIPPSIMFTYADRYTLIGSLEEFIQVICGMDDLYLKHQSDERAKEAQRSKQKSQNKR